MYELTHVFYLSLSFFCMSLKNCFSTANDSIAVCNLLSVKARFVQSFKNHNSKSAGLTWYLICRTFLELLIGCSFIFQFHASCGDLCWGWAVELRGLSLTAWDTSSKEC